MKNIISLIRIKHWIKNVLIFIPLVCSNSFGMSQIINTVILSIAFSFSCSFIYIINDLRDIENDKNDSRKKNRPLPSGSISKTKAIVIAIILLISSVLLVFVIEKTLFNNVFVTLLIYVIINVLYSIGLKDIAVLDIMILAFGFVLRVYYGAFIINVPVSNWLFLTILSFSLYMGIGKRRKELIKGKSVRKVLLKYSNDFLKNFENIFAALVFVFYSLWSLEQPNKYLIFTIVFVIFIFMKYSLTLETSNEGDPITIFYNDKCLMIVSIIYSILFSLMVINI